MLPEFNVNRLKTRISEDTITHFFTVLTTVGFLAYYVITKEYRHTSILPVLIMSGFIAVFITILHLPATKNIAFFQSGGLGNVLIFPLTLSVTYLWYISIYSPFIIAIAPVLFMVLYYRGIVTYFVTVASVILFVALYTLKNGLPNVPHSYLYPILTVLFCIDFGGVMSRAGAMDNRIRQEIGRVSKHAEEERERLSSLINSMRDAVLAIDSHGRVLFYNPAALALLNVHAIPIGGELSDLIAILDSDNKSVNLLKLIHAQRGYLMTRDLHYVTSDKETIDLAIDVAPIRASFGGDEDRGYIASLQDITKEKTLDDQRNEFISVTSHELRTPLAIAEAGISLLMMPKIFDTLEKAGKDSLKQAHDNIIFLADLVTELTTLELAERKSSSTVETSKIDPKAIVQELNENYQPEAATKGLKLTVEAAENLPVLTTNSVFLREILQNLVTNALKYTTEGTITIDAKQGEHGGVLFSIADSGIGIGVTDKPKVFDKYYRSEDYRTRTTRGTGLGLYMVMRLVQQLKGKVWFTSELDKGSTFFVELPLELKADTPPLEESTPEQKSLEPLAEPSLLEQA